MDLGCAQGVADVLKWFAKNLGTQMLQIGAVKLSDLSPELLVRTKYMDVGPPSLW
jgi:isopentenyl diphosphate isomerase/L-lactate dehydrogenase-like FMN-dependent dehydrogenase